MFGVLCLFLFIITCYYFIVFYVKIGKNEVRFDFWIVFYMLNVMVLSCVVLNFEFLWVIWVLFVFFFCSGVKNF